MRLGARENARDVAECIMGDTEPQNYAETT